MIYIYIYIQHIISMIEHNMGSPGAQEPEHGEGTFAWHCLGNHNMVKPWSLMTTTWTQSTPGTR